MHDKYPFLGKSALQIPFFFLKKFVMQFILVRYFCNAYHAAHIKTRIRVVRTVHAGHAVRVARCIGTGIVLGGGTVYVVV